MAKKKAAKKAKAPAKNGVTDLIKELVLRDAKT